MEKKTDKSRKEYYFTCNIKTGDITHYASKTTATLQSIKEERTKHQENKHQEAKAKRTICKAKDCGDTTECNDCSNAKFHKENSNTFNKD